MIQKPRMMAMHAAVQMPACMAMYIAVYTASTRIVALYAAVPVDYIRVDSTDEPHSAIPKPRMMGVDGCAGIAMYGAVSWLYIRLA